LSRGKEITLVVDGLEVQAPEGAMLVDAAKGGDVEIPVFCYEPKLGGPVGACRMCLVEVEGIPKLQTACSTPVRDGMVVYTQTDRVKEAQNAVVEFLLVNHPLDCPVCDKGGECPLQDISMGWGPGKSRVTDPKRHFRKPVPLSPLVRIDRERCILCYRCVRFSQEVAEDEQLQLLERGPRSYVGTFDDRPYIAPFHGNIIELCPVGALTSEAYRFRARPWDIEDAGSVCTLCPSQCNVKFTVRDERVQRVLARDNAQVDDGWLCDKGRFGFQMIDSADRMAAPKIRKGGALIDAGWDEALEKAAAGLSAAKGKVAAIVGGGASNEEGYLAQRIVRGPLASTAVDSRRGGAIPRELLAALSAPELSAALPAVESADSVLLIGADPLHAMPILDLRLRKAIRHSGTKLLIASERPTSLDGGAEETVRYAPGEAGALLENLTRELGAGDGSGNAEAERLAGELRPGSTVVIYGEELGHGPDRERALRALLDCAGELRCAEDGGGIFEVPESSNARGLREVGCVPTAGPGLGETTVGMDADLIREALESEELSAVILWDVDPLRHFADPEGWQRALGAADTVICVGMFGTASGGQADFFFPAEHFAEKEGTVTHPDGRLQRLRPSVPRPGEVRAGWQWLSELSALLGDETGIDSAPEALEALASETAIYAGLTHEEIGGTGVRWQERDAASALAGSKLSESTSSAPVGESAGSEPPGNDSAGENGSLRLGTYRDLWVGEATERSPALHFLSPAQRLEVSPADAERLGVRQGDEVKVRSNGHALDATVAIRERMRPGAGFLIEGLSHGNPNVLAGARSVQIEALAKSGPSPNPGDPGREAEESPG
jgi:NADH-quinone oxidoreductase subunit G